MEHEHPQVPGRSNENPSLEKASITLDITLFIFVAAQICFQEIIKELIRQRQMLGGKHTLFGGTTDERPGRHLRIQHFS